MEKRRSRRDWFGKLRQPRAVLGFFSLVFIEPCLVMLRSVELSSCLAMSGYSDHPLSLAGASLHLSNGQALGLGITLMHALAVSVFALDSSEDATCDRCLRITSVAVLVISGALELYLAVTTAGEGARSVAFLVALLLAVGEPLSGLFAIEKFLIPLCLGLLDKFTRKRTAPRPRRVGLGGIARHCDLRPGISKSPR